MSSRKYQVFVSSTYEDLRDQRDQVVRAILEMGHIPVGMEMFSAADEQQWTIIQHHIDDADYYVVIVAHRYGSMDGDRSYTEKEYDYASSRGVPILGFVIDNSAPWNPERMEKEPTKVAALERFKAKVKRKPVAFWRTASDLYGSVSVALMKQMTATPRTGWIRADQAPGPEVLSELARLSTENASLRVKVASFSEQRADLRVSIVAQVFWSSSWAGGVRGRWSPAGAGPKSGAQVRGINTVLQLANAGTLSTAVNALSLTVSLKDGSAFSSTSCYAFEGWPLAVPQRSGRDSSVIFAFDDSVAPLNAVANLKIDAVEIDGTARSFELPDVRIVEQ